MGVIHLPENTSDHHEVRVIKIKPSWKKVTKEQRNNINKNLEKQLITLQNVITVHCEDKSHFTRRNKCMINILETIDICG